MEIRPPKKRNSILRRVTLMSWLVAVLSVFVFAIFMVRYQRATIQRELETRAQNISRNLEQDLGRSLASTEKKTKIVLQCLKALEKDKDIQYIVVTWTGGESLVHYAPGKFRRDRLSGNWTPPELGSYSTVEFNEWVKTKCMHYTRSSAVDGLGWGWIHVGMSMDGYDESVRGVYVTTGIVGGLTLIIGALASFFFARNMIQPIQVLQSFAHRVANGALHARAIVQSGDELGDLAESINRMVESLETSQTKLRDSMQTAASAREKEILLREIHHRVKNNMQILTSLLRLQTRRANSDEMRTVLQESEARIRSMGLLHEKLYQSESVSQIDLCGYLRTLTNELLRVNTPAGKRREIKLGVRDIFLGLDSALPVGLIVTELVSNSLKYAFPDKVDGVIYISVSKTMEGEYSMIVWDNGIGMDDGFDISKSTSLGMRLVTMLVDQLNGTLSINGKQGTRIEVTFKETQYKHRL